jgi:hypothetical protein
LGVSVTVLWLTDTEVTVRSLPMRVVPSLTAQGFRSWARISKELALSESQRRELSRSVGVAQRGS